MGKWVAYYSQSKFNRIRSVLYPNLQSFITNALRQMTGYPGVPSMTTTLVAHFVHTDLEMTGNIEFSPNDHILNGIQHITRFASLSNYME